MSPAAPRPLLLCADEQITDEVLRLAAVSGVDIEVAVDPGAVRARYSHVPLVLLGAELAQRARRAGLPRRTGVILIARDGQAEEVMPMAQEVAADFIACLPAGGKWLLERLAQAATANVRTGTILGVVGGRGGAGASTLAVALAVTGSRAGLSTLLIDADPMGGGIDITLGWEGEEGLRWPGLAGASGRIDPELLTRALPGRGPMNVLSWNRDGGWAFDGPGEGGWVLGNAPQGRHSGSNRFDARAGKDRAGEVQLEAMAAALDAGSRGRDLVVLDLPRYADGPAVTGIAAAHRVFVVVPAELRATAAAGAVTRAVREHCENLAAVVRGPAPGGLRPPEIAAALGLPLAGELRPEPGLAGDMERGVAPAGKGRGPLAELSRELLRVAGVGL